MAILAAILGGAVTLLVGILGFQHWRNQKRARQLAVDRAFAEAQRTIAETQAEQDQLVRESREKLHDKVRQAREKARSRGCDGPDPLHDALRRLSRLRDIPDED